MMESIVLKILDIIQEKKLRRFMHRDSTFINKIYKVYLEGYEPLTFDGVYLDTELATFKHDVIENDVSMQSIAFYKGKPFVIINETLNGTGSFGYHIFDDDVFEDFIDMLRRSSTLHGIDQYHIDDINFFGVE